MYLKWLTRWSNNTLNCLCAQSRVVCSARKEAGCPMEGPFFEEKGRLCQAVRKRVRFCAGQAVRLCVQKKDRIFASENRIGSVSHTGESQDVSW